jgi:hypothetical protein
LTISGVIPLRNAVKLGYPFELAIRSMRPFCDEVIVLVDPTSEDNTLGRVRALQPDIIVLSPWDMTNHHGHANCEISVQTAHACTAASGDWIFSLQADELLHEADVEPLRAAVEAAQRDGITGLELERLYFYGSLERVRADWTFWLLRLFKRGRWKPDVDGAMRFDPVQSDERRLRTDAARLFHYSRVGDAKTIAERVRNLDLFFHAPARVQSGELPPYDFSKLRKLDTYVVGHAAEADEQAQLMQFPLGCHPALALEHFGGRS